MATQISPLTVWATPAGIALAITRPGAGPDDTTRIVTLPIDYALDQFLPSLMTALNQYAKYKNAQEAVDAAIAEASLNDDDQPTDDTDDDAGDTP
ncbi:hypothetical protein U8D42_03995 [Mycobacterium europaeum]|uniref:hypothetical protein n=1 Tax=Mycobacterium europaeum TaxID=761804 RepID=UPI002ADF8365|nr:hypothetical protein [Mycobacterium europaeum]MEA1159278.1 hypothetical protein [Mycobacterium europaeum]